MPLLLGLQYEEQLPPAVADELRQLVAAIQTGFNSQISGQGAAVNVSMINSLQTIDQLGSWGASGDEVTFALTTQVGAKAIINLISQSQSNGTEFQSVSRVRIINGNSVGVTLAGNGFGPVSYRVVLQVIDYK